MHVFYSQLLTNMLPDKSLTRMSFTVFLNMRKVRKFHPAVWRLRAHTNIYSQRQRVLSELRQVGDCRGSTLQHFWNSWRHRVRTIFKRCTRRPSYSQETH